MLGECQVNFKSQSELDIGGRETCLYLHQAKEDSFEAASSGERTNKLLTGSLII